MGARLCVRVFYGYVYILNIMYEQEWISAFSVSVWPRWIMSAHFICLHPFTWLWMSYLWWPDLQFVRVCMCLPARQCQWPMQVCDIGALALIDPSRLVVTGSVALPNLVCLWSEFKWGSLAWCSPNRHTWQREKRSCLLKIQQCATTIWEEIRILTHCCLQNNITLVKVWKGYFFSS